MKLGNYYCKDCNRYFILLSELQAHVQATNHYDYEVVDNADSQTTNNRIAT